MKNIKINQDWKQNFVKLLNRLDLENKYRCIGGIPGPPLEMRSGTLPMDLASCYRNQSLVPMFAELTGLKLEKILEYAEDISKEYSLTKIIDKYKEIVPESIDREILFNDYVKAFEHKINGLSIYNNYTSEIREIHLYTKNKHINIAYPANLVSLGLIWEIFAEEVYHIEQPVEYIYDFGANIGFSAVYFHLINNGAKIICVEPMEENIRLLEQNIKNNNVCAEIICAAAGREEKMVDLFFGEQSFALPSLNTKQSCARKVLVVPFDKIVNGKGYGLKIDIEGAEEWLVEFPSIVENAAWIVGELHYSGDDERNSRIDGFFKIVKDNFIVKKGRPVVYFVGNEVLLCEGFKTVKKL